MPADTVTIDREALDRILVEIGGLADFVDRVYGGHMADSFVWHEILGVQRELAVAAGLEGEFDTDASDLDARYELEKQHEREVLGRFLSSITPVAVTADA